jgi:hypothetical protein
VRPRVGRAARRFGIQGSHLTGVSALPSLG